MVAVRGTDRNLRINLNPWENPDPIINPDLRVSPDPWDRRMGQERRRTEEKKSWST